MDGNSLEQDYERLLQWQDLVIRVLRNPKMSPVYRELYIALFDTYPDVLKGKAISVEAWRVRENAGWASESSATKFFQDLVSIGAFQYDPGRYKNDEGKRIGCLTPDPDIFPYPESFDTKGAEKRRKAKDAEEKKRKQFLNPLQLFQCEECGSNDLVYDATARCKACGHVHAPIKDIPAANITIEAELIEIADELDVWDDSPTIQVGAIQQQQLPETPRPAPITFGKHPRGIACPGCHSLNHWYAVTTDWGGEMHYCGVCMPPEGA